MYKICSKCKEEKLLENFSRKARNKDGLKAHCKSCDEVYYSANRVRILEQKQQYYLEHQEDMIVEKRLYRKENSVKIKEKDKIRYVKNRARILEYKKIYNLKNKDSIRKYHILYSIRNRHILTALHAKRRARKLNATPDWLTVDDFEHIQEFYTIAKMFKLYTGQDYHVDHIVPLQGENVCGLHVPWNLQVLTATDNLSKSNRFAD
jgi:hypothetical protein